MKEFLLLLLIIGGLRSYSQNQIDCEELQNISIDFSLDKIDSIRNELYQLTFCGIDSIDIDTYYTQEISLLLVKNSHYNTENETNLKAIAEKINQLKSDDKFQKLREITIISKKLSKETINLNDWERIKLYFEKIETPNFIINDFYNYLLENKIVDLTYTQAFKNFMIEYGDVKN